MLSCISDGLSNLMIVYDKSLIHFGGMMLAIVEDRTVNFKTLSVVS